MSHIKHGRGMMHRHQEVVMPAYNPNFSAESLRRLLAVTQVTSAHSFVEAGRSVEDYRASIAMYMDRYLETGELLSLAKLVLKLVTLREFLNEGSSPAEPA